MRNDVVVHEIVRSHMPTRLCSLTSLGKSNMKVVGEVLTIAWHGRLKTWQFAENWSACMFPGSELQSSKNLP